MLKLLIHTQETILISATLLDVFSETTEAVQTGIDASAYAALQGELGGQHIPESQFFERCGLFTSTIVVLTTQGQRHILAPTAQLIDPPEETADILRHASTGKYRVVDGAIVLNLAWQEPTFYIDPLSAKEESKAAPVKVVAVKKKR